MAHLEVDEETFSAIFDTSIPEIVTRGRLCREALDAGNTDALSLNAHTLKSTSAAIGAMALKTAAGNLETAARDNRQNQFAPLLAKVDMEMERLVRLVEAG
jgi:HPt (histidine-containing phosphotransfer) domain-containing protein